MQLFWLVLWVLLPLSQAKTVSWRGYDWSVKDGNGMGPGPNDWYDCWCNASLP
jgi:hypothetical protein